MAALPFSVDQAGYFFLVFVRVVTMLALMHGLLIEKREESLRRSNLFLAMISLC